MRSEAQSTRIQFPLFYLKSSFVKTIVNAMFSDLCLCYYLMVFKKPLCRFQILLLNRSGQSVKKKSPFWSFKNGIEKCLKFLKYLLSTAFFKISVFAFDLFRSFYTCERKAPQVYHPLFVWWAVHF